MSGPMELRKAATLWIVLALLFGIWCAGYYTGKSDQAEVATAKGGTIHRMPAPVLHRHHYRWRHGVASTYGIGDGLVGHNKANGRPLTRHELTVAHKTLPLGTKLVLKYRGRQCVVTVRDRGPYTHGRSFDLAPAVARRLHFHGVHTIHWRKVARRHHR